MIPFQSSLLITAFMITKLSNSSMKTVNTPISLTELFVTTITTNNSVSGKETCFFKAKTRE